MNDRELQQKHNIFGRSCPCRGCDVVVVTNHPASMVKELHEHLREHPWDEKRLFL